MSRASNILQEAQYYWYGPASVPGTGGRDIEQESTKKARANLAASEKVRLARQKKEQDAITQRERDMHARWRENPLPLTKKEARLKARQERNRARRGRGY